LRSYEKHREHAGDTTLRRIVERELGCLRGSGSVYKGEGDQKSEDQVVSIRRMEALMPGPRCISKEGLRKSDMEGRLGRERCLTKKPMSKKIGKFYLSARAACPDLAEKPEPKKVRRYLLRWMQCGTYHPHRRITFKTPGTEKDPLRAK